MDRPGSATLGTWRRSGSRPVGRGGLLTTAQAYAAGRGLLVRRRTRSGEWVELGQGVLAPAALPTHTGDICRELTRLALAGRRWAWSHTTAADLLGLLGPGMTRLPAVHVVVATSPLPSLPGVEVHLTAPAALAQRRPLEGGYVLAVPDVVLGCAELLDRDDVVTVVERALRLRRTTVPVLRAACRRGRHGSARLRDVLDELTADGVDRWARVLRRALTARGVASTPQLWLRDTRGRAHPADLGIDGTCWVAEVDDVETHGSPEAQARDRELDRWAWRELGIRVFRTTPRELRVGAGQVADDLVAVVRRPNR